MAKNEKTSSRVATIAGKTLSDPNASKREKTLAASVLTQAPDKPAKPAKSKPKKS
jgi:hypothetical protein